MNKNENTVDKLAKLLVELGKKKHGSDHGLNYCFAFGTLQGMFESARWSSVRRNTVLTTVLTTALLLVRCRACSSPLAGAMSLSRRLWIAVSKMPRRILQLNKGSDILITMKNKQFLYDLLAYVRYIHNDSNKSDRAKYLALVSTLGHDLNGILNEDKCFRPRVSGYSALEQH